MDIRAVVLFRKAPLAGHAVKRLVVCETGPVLVHFCC